MPQQFVIHQSLEDRKVIKRQQLKRIELRNKNNDTIEVLGTFGLIVYFKDILKAVTLASESKDSHIVITGLNLSSEYNKISML